MLRTTMVGLCFCVIAGCSSETRPMDDPMGGEPGPMTGPDDMPPMDTPETPSGIAVLGAGSHALDGLQITVVAQQADGLNAPRDLAFNPYVPGELWVVNQANDSITVIQDAAGTPTFATHSGPGSRHFLARPSGIAFGDEGIMATAHEEDEITQPSTPADFMGPTLWTTDLAIFNGGHAGHLDMLHNSPNAAGIEWDTGNAYFVFDGAHNSITHYDFRTDHGPGGADHSDGVVRRFVEGEVSYVPGVPSHMEMDRTTGLLYVADTGNSRVAILDPSVGTNGEAIFPNYDGTDQWHVVGGSLTTFVDGSDVGLQRPSGLALHGDHVFVTDNATSVVAGFDMEGELVDYAVLTERIPQGGLMGITFDDAGDLYVVDGIGHRVLRIASAD